MTDDAERLALIKITSVGALSAEAVVEQAKGEITPLARCVEEAPGIGHFRLKVDLSCLPEEARKGLEDGLVGSKLAIAADDPQTADIRAYVLQPRTTASEDQPVPQISVVETPAWALVNREGALAMRLHAFDKADVIRTLVDNLETIARYRNALALENTDTRLDVEFNILRESAPGEWTIANDGNPVFEEGDRIAFELTNNGGKPVHFSVLDFGVTNKIELVYPPNGAAEMLAAGRTVRIGTGDSGPTLGVPEEFAGELGTETLKVFITSDESDFSWLEQSGTRSAVNSRSPLQQLFEAAFTGPPTRDTGAFQQAIVEDWAAIGRTFKLRKSPI
jgi:hypothetical protein